jgi:hypothetical protein
MDLSLSLPRMEGVDLRPWVPPEHSRVISSARRVLAADERGAAGQPADRDGDADVAADGVPASFLAMQWRASAGMAHQKLQVGFEANPWVLEQLRASVLCSATAARAPACPPWPWMCKELRSCVDRHCRVQLSPRRAAPTPPLQRARGRGARLSERRGRRGKRGRAPGARRCDCSGRPCRPRSASCWRWPRSSCPAWRSAAARPRPSARTTCCSRVRSPTAPWQQHFYKIRKPV